MIINAGIGEIVYAEGYPDRLSLDLLADTDIVVRKVERD